jgi:hypothetical protein
LASARNRRILESWTFKLHQKSLNWSTASTLAVKTPNESEVVSAAVRLVHQRQQLQKDLAQSCEELAGGRLIDAAQVFAELRTKIAELSRR